MCTGCNKGCEGVTFWLDSECYLDLFLEIDEEGRLKDIYQCYKLDNILDLKKKAQLNLFFYKDEEVEFLPDVNYKFIADQSKLLIDELSEIKELIELDEILNWYSNYYRLVKIFKEEYDILFNDKKLYLSISGYINDLEILSKIKRIEIDILDDYLDFKSLKTEREKLIWLFENSDNHTHQTNFYKPPNWEHIGLVNFKTTRLNLTLDMSKYKYVLDYLDNINNTYDFFMDKYNPTKDHYKLHPKGIEYSLHKYLEVHGVYLDLVERYKDKFYL